MDLKTLFGLTVIPAGFFGGIVASVLSKRLRELFFLLLVFLSPLIERLDLNYVSRDWYRGTSRGFEVAVSDILAVSVLMGTLLAPRQGQRRAFWPASFGFMLLFFLYACFNVAISDPKLWGLFELFRMFRGLILVLAVAFFVQSERELKLFLLGMAMLVGYEALLAVKQRYIDGIHRVPGTLIESNSLSVLLCTTAPVMVAAVASRLPRLLKILCALTLPVACVAMVMTISRAGVIILGTVMFLTALATATFRITAKNCAIAAVVVLGATGILAKSWKTLATRFGESTLDEEYGKKKNLGRGYYLHMAKVISADRFFGVGLNNWSFWVSNRYGPGEGYRFVPYRGTDHEPSAVMTEKNNVDMPQAAPAHNLGALTLGELGIPGLALFALLWLRWFQMGGSFLRPRTADPLRRIGVGIFFGFLGMFLQCLTEWVFRHVPLYYTFHVMLGVLMALCFLKKRSRQAEAVAYKHAGETRALPGFQHYPAPI
jgi:hypothetical protein